MRFLQVLIVCFLNIGTLSSAWAQEPEGLPTPYVPGSNIKINYVRTWEATAPEQNANTLIARPLRDVKQATQYFDGLGRPLQTVIKQGSLTTVSGSNVDLITAVTYDEFGREQFKYLPFASMATDATKNDGLFKLNPFQQQADFFNSHLSGQPNEINVGPNNLNWAYSQTSFEPSSLNRVSEVFAPGSSWVGTSGEALETNRRSIKTKYFINTADDDVRIWNVTDGIFPSLGTYSSPGEYAAGELYKTITVDEKNKQVIEFKDKEGKVILKKVQLTATADDGTGKNHDGWLCTYYIYDDLGLLRCVIQPEGVKSLSNTATFNWSLTYSSGILLNEQCFRYEYDGRNRMVMKKVPGAGEVYMVYDARDRLVMTQDANLRAINKWLVTLYDEWNRPVQTGLLLNTWDNKTFAQHLAAAYSSTAYPFSVTAPPSTTYWEYLTRTGYDDYSTIPAASGLTSSIDNTYINSTYGFFTTYNASPDYAQQIPAAASAQTNGMVTWTEIKVLETGNYLYTVNLYDEKARLVQVKSKNYTGTVDIVTTQYNWSGQALVSVYKQEKGGTGAQTSVIVTKSYYDDLGRLIQTDKKVQNTNVNSNALPATYTTISKNEYDALGQLRKKKLAPAYNNNAGLETLTYDYNIRGWVLGANRDYAKDANNTNYFGFDLGYDKANNGLINNQTYTAAQYNGNITGMVWKSKGDGEKRKYDFTYDAVNRLTGADFNQYTGSAFNKTANVDFSVSSLSYDANGNIITMNQKGLKLNASPAIDQLSYTYQPNSNRLAKVVDIIAGDNKLGDFKDGTNTDDDYNYDVNGNMTIDRNKKIDWIDYNFLNLPRGITIRDNSNVNNTIVYKYDANGNKLQKEVYPGAVPPGKITLYLGLSVFQDNVLQFISSEEGRIRFVPANGSVPAGFAYDYFLKDHLGNVRMLLTEEQKQDQYPAATSEPATITSESSYYGNLTNTQYTKPSWFTDPLYTTSTKVSQVKNAAGFQKVGPNMVLKVMAGDSYNIRVASGWNSASAATNSSTNVLADLLNLLSGGVATVSGGKVTQGELQNSSSGLNTGLTSFLATQTTSGTKPKAYISWILLDEQFKVAKDASDNMLTSGYSGFEQVGASGSATIHTRNNLAVAKSGYLYIYVSNEASNIDVFFDNLQVTHIRGPLLEETHYYPFGLTMAGISSKALAFGNPENKKNKFQNQEINDDLGVNYYEFKWRHHDPQIGRFIQIDPLSEKYVYYSTYTFSGNQVTRHVELEGLEPVDAIGLMYGTSDAYTRKVGAEQGVSPALIDALLSRSSRAQAVGTLVGTGVALSFLYPQTASLIMASELSGVPLNPSPQMMAGTLVTEASNSMKVYETLSDVTSAVSNVVKESSVAIENVTINAGEKLEDFIVIGRNMPGRVEPFAAELNAAGIRAETWKGFDASLSTEVNLANNQAWITERIKNGVSVINIGLDPKYTSIGNLEIGVYYGMENQVVGSTQWIGTGTITKAK